ncbi:MAG: hypothetical protein HWE23_07800 [Rhodobacteraceae bacterium]|nr:hypothetical protein [Paracoccaceae bacterium]
MFISRIALFVSILLFGISTAKAETIGLWKTEDVQGFQKYWTTTKNGDSFAIWCNPSRSVSGTVIDIAIKGFRAPPDRSIRLIFGRSKLMHLQADKDGYVQTNCAACADAYKVVWNRMRSGGHVAVKFDDERYAVFSLKGANKILTGNMCPADFYK